MVEEFDSNDIDEIMNIWLNTNIVTHSYIKESYWKGNYDNVRKAILDAKVYVYKEDGIILGFVGLVEDYVAGIFVRECMRGRGIGKKLLDECKKTRSKLTLEVYEKNIKATKFYLRENFKMVEKSTNHDTNEIEYLMMWKKGE